MNGESRTNAKSQRVSPDHSALTSMLKSRIQRSMPRRKPPPVSPPNELNVHTGLPLNSPETGYLHAAQLAVSQHSHMPVSNNRRSSFTKENGIKADLNRSMAHASSSTGGNGGGGGNNGSGGGRSSTPTLPVITGLNSKFLARSSRK